ncbi:MAG: hypothetical protein FWG70_02890 [Oscillospiraceae bacterium]|nr:hypothetical protein [Oscillospiraceae bacterium]
MESNKKLNPAGLLFLLIGTAVTGSIISFVYLLINRYSPYIQLCVLSAAFFGILVGVVVKLIIKLFKIKSVAPAVLAVILGCFGFSYFKWALYVATDASSEFSESYIYWYAHYFVDDFLDEDGNLYSDSELQDIITDMREMSAYDYIIAYGQEDLWDLKSWADEDLQVLKNESFYSYCGHDIYLSSGSIPAAAGTVKDEYGYSWYNYYLYFNEHYDYPTATYYMANPGELFDTIVKINAEGRWGFTDADSNVNGLFLWVLWAAEFIIICFIAVVMVPAGIKALEPPVAETALEGMRINQNNPPVKGSVSQTAWNSDGIGGASPSTEDDTDEFGRPIAQAEKYPAMPPIPPATSTSNVQTDEFVDEFGRPMAEPDPKY